jgi:hypothetical protein
MLLLGIISAQDGIYALGLFLLKSVALKIKNPQKQKSKRKNFACF